VTISERAVMTALVALCALGAGDAGGDWADAVPDRRWSFPVDHWAHRDFRTEWWYFTGHLACTDQPGQRFGYQFTLFRIGLLTDPPRLDSDWSTDTLIMGHAAITDLSEGEHRFTDVLFREAPRLGEFGSYPDPLVAWVRPPPGTGTLWKMRHNGDAFDLEMRDDARGLRMRLSTTPLKPRVFQGPNGWSRKGREPGAASHYYSYTRLYTTGRVRFGELECGVDGTSWMDHEFSSSQLLPEQVGWDWFSLQLDDGRDLMLYLMRRADGSVDYRIANLVDPAARVAHLGEEEWSMRAVATWTSERTGAVYPAGWVVEVPGEQLELRIVPLLPDQENRGRVKGAPYYYEGAVQVLGGNGERLGRGYVELTGYGDDNRPPV
jgi:predicted secreted hydrolase